jgi:hypothetical protein
LPSGLIYMKNPRILVLILATVAMIVAAFLVPRFGQPQSYHVFADARTSFGIPHFLNVVSNGAFLIVGALGLGLLIFRPNVFVFERPAEKVPYMVLFAGILLTAFGSSWYHLAPSHDSLMWDRLPMSVIFASFISITIVERIGVKAGLASLIPCVLIGAATFVYWHATEMAGQGDLRPYVFMQFYPTVGIPLAMALLPPRYTRAGYLLFIIVLYGFSRIPEIYDVPVYSQLGVVSGHTMKHIIAAIALTPVFVMLRRRAIGDRR